MEAPASAARLGQVPLPYRPAGLRRPLSSTPDSTTAGNAAPTAELPPTKVLKLQPKAPGAVSVPVERLTADSRVKKATPLSIASAEEAADLTIVAPPGGRTSADPVQPLVPSQPQQHESPQPPAKSSSIHRPSVEGLRAGTGVGVSAGTDRMVGAARTITQPDIGGETGQAEPPGLTPAALAGAADAAAVGNMDGGSGAAPTVTRPAGGGGSCQVPVPLRAADDGGAAASRAHQRDSPAISNSLTAETSCTVHFTGTRTQPDSLAAVHASMAQGLAPAAQYRAALAAAATAATEPGGAEPHHSPSPAPGSLAGHSTPDADAEDSGSALESQEQQPLNLSVVLEQVPQPVWPGPPSEFTAPHEEVVEQPTGRVGANEEPVAVPAVGKGSAEEPAVVGRLPTVLLSAPPSCRGQTMAVAPFSQLMGGLPISRLLAPLPGTTAGPPRLSSAAAARSVQGKLRPLPTAAPATHTAVCTSPTAHPSGSGGVGPLRVGRGVASTSTASTAAPPTAGSSDSLRMKPSAGFMASMRGARRNVLAQFQPSSRPAAFIVLKDHAASEVAVKSSSCEARQLGTGEPAGDAAGEDVRPPAAQLASVGRFSCAGMAAADSAYQEMVPERLQGRRSQQEGQQQQQEQGGLEGLRQELQELCDTQDDSHQVQMEQEEKADREGEYDGRSAAAARPCHSGATANVGRDVDDGEGRVLCNAEDGSQPLAAWSGLSMQFLADVFA